MENRYKKNLNSITKEECKKLQGFNVCVVGCGGIGGYVIEMLARIGVLNITGIDYDVFDLTNLNRQIISHTTNIHEKKALEAKKRVFAINPDVYFTPICEKVTSENAIDILAGNNIIIDACDNISTRFILEEACNKLETPLIHGAISGWYGQVSTIMPYDNTISKIYANMTDTDIDTSLGNPAFTPALVASIQVSEAIKVLLDKGDTLHKKLLTVDLLNMNFDIIDFE